MSEDFDPVTKPKHYNIHPSGVECIQITEHFNFCLGNAIKYIWRANEKNGVEDLKKAIWYLQREIEKMNQPCDNCESTNTYFIASHSMGGPDVWGCKGCGGYFDVWKKK